MVRPIRGGNNFEGSAGLLLGADRAFYALPNVNETLGEVQLGRARDAGGGESSAFTPTLARRRS
jgi:hypothetical protein